MCDHLEDAHLLGWLAETGAAVNRTPFDKWVEVAAATLGVPHLDADESRHGYSLDGAYAEFQKGITPSEYAHIVRARRRLARSVNAPELRAARERSYCEASPMRNMPTDAWERSQWGFERGLTFLVRGRRGLRAPAG